MSRCTRSAAALIAAAIGIDEIGLFAALALLSVGAGEVWRPARWLAPALVLLWIYLPQRASFIERPAVKDRRAE